MELHLHLSAAFRALDRKWGPTVDLDASTTFIPFTPAIVDLGGETFSSEQYLKSVKRTYMSRHTPYSRDERRRRKNVDRSDSFANISIPAMSSTEDLGPVSELSYKVGVASDDSKEKRSDLLKKLKKNVHSLVRKKLKG